MFMPVGTQGSVKGLTSKQLQDLDAGVVLGAKTLTKLLISFLYLTKITSQTQETLTTWVIGQVHQYLQPWEGYTNS